MRLSAWHTTSARCNWRLLIIVAFLVPLGCNRAVSAPPPTAPAEQVQPAPTVPQGAAAPSPDAGGGPQALPAGDSTRGLMFDGIERDYLLHIPAGYDAANPTPLVLAFHGIGLDAGEMIRISGFSAQADTSGFVVAYPNGTGAEKSWNGGHCCGEAAKNRVDDVGFVRAVIDDISAAANIDPARIYATGFSNGAIFVYRLACQLADRIAAIGPIGATQVLNDEQACPPGRPIPIIHFHGTADRLNPYGGATTAVGLEWVSVPHAVEFWAARNGCTAGPTSTTVGSIAHEVYSACAQNATVELYTITDGEHAWPGGEAVSAQVGEPTLEISATPLMWEFFAAHPLP